MNRSELNRIPKLIRKVVIMSGTFTSGEKKNPNKGASEMSMESGLGNKCLKKKFCKVISLLI